mgnify:CR=1 FL=1
MFIKIRNKKSIVLIVLILVVISAVVVGEAIDYKRSFQDKLIRFHVIANSDAPFDQALKLKIRDRIFYEMNDKFNTKNIDEARVIIKDNIDYIERIALDEVNTNGYNYSVNVALEEHDFPTKNYGSITLPAGNYEALRIVIGDGEGKNWWCVLFPPLCFVDVEHGLTDEATKEKMQTVLTEEEFELINTAANDGKMPVKVKFKTIEILEKSKHKLSKILKK